MPKRFFPTLARLLDRYCDLNAGESLIVLQTLVAEVNRGGGFASQLAPSAPKPAKVLTIEFDRDFPATVLRYALGDLASAARGTHTGKTHLALRRILTRWGKGKRGFRTLDADACLQAGNAMTQLGGFVERDFKDTVNTCHPGARRIFGIRLFIEEDGRLAANVTFGYPRDSSEWTIHPRDREEAAKDAWGELSAELWQRDNEDGPGALGRIVRAIESRLVPVDEASHRETGRREQWFRALKPALTDGNRSLRIGCGKFQADAGTRARFGEVEMAPYSRAEETASMIADLLAHSDVTEGELIALSVGLRRMRELRGANASAAGFIRSLANRNYGNFRQRPTVRPNYQALKVASRAASELGARLFAHIPAAGHDNGLIRVPWSRVRLIQQRDRFQYRGRTMDIGAVRQIDVLPREVRV